MAGADFFSDEYAADVYVDKPWEEDGEWIVSR